MSRFVREILELWGWALFLPSRLQRRQNEWCPLRDAKGKESDTAPYDILFLSIHPRFLSQYIVLTTFLSLPLGTLILIKGESEASVLILISVLTSYTIGLFSLSLGVHFPLLFFLVWIPASSYHQEFLQSAFSMFASPYQCAVYAGIGTANLMITLYAGNKLSEVEQVAPNVRRNVVGKLLVGALVIGTGLGIIILMCWSENRSWLFTISTLLLGFLFLLVSVLTGYYRAATAGAASMISFQAALVSFAFAMQLLFPLAPKTAVLSSVASTIITAIVMIGLIMLLIPDAFIRRKLVMSDASAFQPHRIKILGEQFLCYVGVLGGGIIGLLLAIGISSFGLALQMLPLSLYCVGCWVIAVCFSSIRLGWRKLGVLSAALVAVGVVKFGFLAALVFPLIFLGYFRILPDYLVLSFVSLWLYRSNKDETTDRFIKWLPPFSHEFAWFPIPYHDLLLARYFQYRPPSGVEVLQHLRNSQLASLAHTLNRTIPSLIVEQITTINNVEDIPAIATQNHPYIPRLIELCASPQTLRLDEFNLSFAKTPDGDLNVLLPRIQIIAGNIRAALKAGSASVRERSLVKCLDELRQLRNELPVLLGNENGLIWQKALGKWDAILYREIDEQQAQAFREIVNPFHSGAPLRLDQEYLFKGRKNFADEILSQLLQRSQSTLVIYGPRRCGKTSFLFNLPRLLSSDVIPVYLSAQAQGAVNSNSDFCYTLVETLQRTLQTKGIQTRRIERSAFRAEPFPQLEDWLVETMRLIGSRRLLVSIDEFEKLGKALSERRITDRLFDELRDVFQRHAKMNLLFAGVQTLDELGPNWSSYFISLRPIEMVYLEKDEATELITKPHRSFDLEYNEGVVDELTSLTRNHPYLLQLMGESIVKQANKFHTRRITSALVSEAAKSALISGTAYFHNLWHEFTGTSKNERLVGRQILLAIARGESPPLLDDEDAKKALSQLKRHHIIEEDDGSHRFEVPLIELWVRERGDA